jgi:hypothetical protein
MYLSIIRLEHYPFAEAINVEMIRKGYCRITDENQKR